MASDARHSNIIITLSVLLLHLLHVCIHTNTETSGASPNTQVSVDTLYMPPRKMGQQLCFYSVLLHMNCCLTIDTDEQ